MNNIIVVSPVHVATGGTELLQQLVEELRKLGYSAKMYYTGQYENSPVQRRFSEYENPHVEHISDEKNTIVVVSETNIDLLHSLKNCKKIIWWLSVDNYYGSLKKSHGKIRRIYHKVKDCRNKKEFRNCIHLVQSEYARLFLLKEKKIDSNKILYLSDYLNKVFLNDVKNCIVKKENNILYNPKKGKEFTTFLRNNINEYNWIALENLKPEEMKDILLRSKLYVDFGNHPGKDRIPREASVCGCCVITGLQGAAANDIDVQIPRKYKFKDSTESIEAIHSCITECMTNYEECKNDFINYIDRTYAEEKEFKFDVERIFSSLIKN